jgi:NTP pyrophosphatase (non-canonical NTP hydrolase)
MDDKKWRNEKSVDKLMVKLAEETGEVAKAVGDGYFNKQEKRALDEECQHVMFIASLIRHRLERSPYTNLPRLADFAEL